MKEQIAIIGGGAIGFSLAATLQSENRNVIVYRVSMQNHTPEAQRVYVTLQDGRRLEETIPTVSLTSNAHLKGIALVTAKAFGNPKIAELLENCKREVDLVLLQNGIGIENPFIEKGFRSISRCVVYITAEKLDSNEFTARMVNPSPIGILENNGCFKLDIPDSINSNYFKFYEEEDILKEVWKKGIINTVFNSICPILDIDNGIFARDFEAFELAKEIVQECIPVANEVGVSITSDEVLEQITTISLRSDGQLISTLQDILARRETEIQFFNMAICNIAANFDSNLVLPKTKLLGLLVEKKSKIRMEKT